MHHHEHREFQRERHCSPSGRSGHGHGRRNRGRNGRGGNPFRVGKMLGDGDLRLIVLALLTEQSRHGYDIIKALEEHTSGFYSPSPGIVYPTLTFLEEAGHASAATEGNKKVYTISKIGRAHLDENREQVDAVLSQIAKVGRELANARDSVDDTDRRSSAARSDRDIPHVIPEVNEARRELKHAIAEKLDASKLEQRRVAKILSDAAAAIRDTNSGEPDDIDLG
jgi:DNA-binding PadR family transcriptional regulator